MSALMNFLFGLNDLLHQSSFYMLAAALIASIGVFSNLMSMSACLHTLQTVEAALNNKSWKKSQVVQDLRSDERTSKMILTFCLWQGSMFLIIAIASLVAWLFVTGKI